VDFPKLRNVNIFPIQMSGQTLLCLQDPQNISEKALFLPPVLYFVVSLFDGRHSVLDIQAEYMRQFGEFLFTEKIQEIVDQLEENLFLEGDRFREALMKKEDIFKKSPVREASYAGKSYEKEPELLRAQLENYFDGEDGPGPLEGGGSKNGLRGVVVPHIDFQRGGSCYAFAHRELWERNSSRCFIIFGIAHTFMEQPFCLTRKDFMTPLGTLSTDRELVDTIQSHYSVPILSGSFHEAVEKGISPMELRPFRDFVDAVRESVSSFGERVCYIASADLSHVGLQFGDREGLKEYDLRILAEEDQQMLGYVERIDAEGFFSSISKEKDRRRVCGLPAIYTMLKVIEAKEGKLIKYGQAFTPETQSAVSFASMAFY
jgi:predicted class III extradiol MEMO1 family dioxygenase